MLLKVLHMASNASNSASGSFRQLSKSVTLATLANLTGRIANVAITLAVITICGANRNTDQFFFVLAVAFYFYGIVANAIAQSTTPMLINGGLQMARKHLYILAICATLVFFSLALAINAAFIHTSPVYLLALALMAGAGLANGAATGQWHAREQYAPPGFSWSLRLIPLLVWIAAGKNPVALPYLALGIGLADCLRFLVLATGIRPRPPASRPGAPLFSKPVLITYGTVILTALINGLNPLIDRMIANLNGPGAISILEAGERIYMMLASLSTMGIGMVLLTRLSQDAANGTLADNWPRILRFVGYWVLCWMIAGTLLGTWGLQWWLDAAAGLNPEQVHDAVWVYGCYLGGLPFFALALVYVKRLQALERWWVMVVTSTVSVGLNIPLSLFLNHLMGVAGIALATTAIHLVNGLILITAAHKN